MNNIKAPAVKDQLSALLRDQKEHLKSFLDKSTSFENEINFKPDEIKASHFALSFVLGNVRSGSFLEEIRSSSSYVEKATWMFLNPQLIQNVMSIMESGQEPPDAYKSIIYISAALVYEMIKKNEVDLPPFHASPTIPQ